MATIMSQADARPLRPAPTVFLESVFEAATVRPWTCLMFALGMMVTVAEGADVAAASAVAPLLQAHFGFSPKFMGLVLASGVFGTVAASYLLSPIADRLGRRPAVIAGLSLACLSSLASAFVPTVSWLIVGRILAGAGVGLTTPAIYAIVAETLPTRLRAMGTMIAGCGFILGAAVSAFLVSLLTGAYGYRSAFFVASGLELAVICICVVLLPESPFFLVRKGLGTLRVRQWLARLGAAVLDPQSPLAVRRADPKESRISALFTQDHRPVTLALWLANFCTLSLIYLTGSWLPALLVRSGENVQTALRFFSLSSLAGAVVAMAIAWSTTRVNPARILIVGYAVLMAAAIGLFAWGGTGGVFHALLAAQIITNASMQFCLMGVINRYYSSAIRATGVGYALGAGRFGAFAAPLAGGYLVQQGESIETIMGLTAIPALIACLSIGYLIVTGKLHRNEATANAH